MTRSLLAALALSGCTYVTIVQPPDDAGAPPADAASEESGCLRWEASPGSEYHEGSPEDLRCVEWGDDGRDE